MASDSVEANASLPATDVRIPESDEDEALSLTAAPAASVWERTSVTIGAAAAIAVSVPPKRRHARVHRVSPQKG